ncbi:MAG: hypothetical protein HHJ12_03405 [Glaciimonas sp.]|nr:hypothetical protein [Glaciimonas sp.]
MKRLFDFGLALFALLILLIPLCVVAVLVKLTSAGPVVYWSDRVGRRKKNSMYIRLMQKF